MPRPLRALLLALGALLALAAAAPTPALAHGLLVAAPVDGGRTPDSASGPPVALASHRVSVRIEGPVADVTVEQRFLNRTDRQLEATYLFPLPDGAAVARFAMTLGGKMVEGEVMDAGEARAIYESIVRRRRDPGLLEYVGRGLFRAQVFPIEPRAAVDVRLTFQQVLPDDAGTLEFRYPLATDRLHGQPVDEVVVTVDVASEVPIRALYSPSHAVAVVQTTETQAHASYEGSGTRQARDFLLYVGRSPEDVGFSVISQQAAGEPGTFLAVLAPSIRSTGQVLPKDVIFVLDTSGSMAQDDKIGQARRALSFGLGVLRPEDRFGLVTFAGQPHRFRDVLLDATPENREAARSWLEHQVAEGGTNLAGGLEQALGLVQPGRLPIVVLLSDGKPTVGARDVETILQGVRTGNPHGARVFTFGVGFDLDVALLDRIAEATRGARDYVQPREELEITTSRFFRKVVDPVLTDVTVELGEGVFDVYPAAVPDLFSGGQVVLMGRYETPGARRFTLRGKVGEKEVEHVYEVRLRDDEKARFLPRLWANRKVAFLLDEIRLHGEDAELVAEVKRLALKHAIVTPYTSNLVTEDAELERVANARRVPPTSPPPGPWRRAGSGGGGYYRGPGDVVPPGLREPSDPTPPVSPPPSGPPTTPSPVPTTPGTPTTPTVPAPPSPSPTAKAAEVSKDLRGKKENARAEDEAHVRVAGGRTFAQKDGRWVDTAWNEAEATAPPTKVVAFSEAWMELGRKDPKVSEILALGERVVFVWEGKAYEVVPD